TSTTTTSLPMVSIYCGLSADELTLWSGGLAGNRYYYTNNLSTTTAGSEMWNYIYPNLFTCNSAVESIGAASALTPVVKTQLLGEAKFLRALFYFYLTNLYGDVPLILTSDYNLSKTAGRTAQAQ